MKQETISSIGAILGATSSLLLAGNLLHSIWKERKYEQQKTAIKSSLNDWETKIETHLELVKQGQEELDVNKLAMDNSVASIIREW